MTLDEAKREIAALAQEQIDWLNDHPHATERAKALRAGMSTAFEVVGDILKKVQPPPARVDVGRMSKGIVR